ncbi:Cell surface Cu-only superoxide dismutase [Lachnellula suecica]|uniref:superoxide dismutase n=1 Tax=Lachnellula suecica TaxID=602035 RepID=A0A8T9CDU7_9HELO|nr:Cell surface Cu-only superoxide dismutase [Lachnellula suecica]
MFATTIISVFLATLLSSVSAQNLTTGALGNATVVTNNPPGAVYLATLPTTEFNNPSDPRGNVKGSIVATASPNGIGVSFAVSFSNLPTSGGPFVYHIHDQPVPEDGNCNSTLAHLDPFIRGETPVCNSTLPQTCQVGDLSGKHGKIESDPFVATYTDDFATTVNGLGSFFGNRSFVIHFANKTRITCANFALSGSTATNASCPPNSTASATASNPAQFTGAGTKSTASMALLLGVIALAILL